MKSKVTMLMLAGAMALSATAPNAMASNQKGNAARSPKSVTTAKAQSATKKAGSRAWVPNHVLFPGLVDKK